jgi:undecaprenyl pyrophosphate phosphatase UppP
MSAPLIAGAAVLEVLKSFGSSAETPDVSWSLAVYGCLLSAVVGYFSLKALIIALKGKWFWLFGPYCVLAGLVTLLFCGA